MTSPFMTERRLRAVFLAGLSAIGLLTAGCGSHQETASGAGAATPSAKPEGMTPAAYGQQHAAEMAQYQQQHPKGGPATPRPGQPH